MTLQTSKQIEEWIHLAPQLGRYRMSVTAVKYQWESNDQDNEERNKNEIERKHKNENNKDNENNKEINNNNKNENQNKIGNEDRTRMIILTSSQEDVRKHHSTHCIIYYHIISYPITIYRVIIFYHQSYAPDSRG